MSWKVDLPDLLLGIGFLMVAVAVYWLADWPGLLGFVGVLVMTIAMVMARDKVNKG